MKYIMFEDFGGQVIPFLFPDKVSHADMREQMPYSKVISAGYIYMKNGSFVCSGGDVELGLSVSPEDALLMKAFFVEGK